MSAGGNDDRFDRQVRKLWQPQLDGVEDFFCEERVERDREMRRAMSERAARAAEKDEASVKAGRVLIVPEEVGMSQTDSFWAWLRIQRAADEAERAQKDD